MAQSEDRPIIVGGGPGMVTIELPQSFKNLTQKGKFSVVPKDAAVPFKSLVVKNGSKEVLNVTIKNNWMIRIE